MSSEEKPIIVTVNTGDTVPLGMYRELQHENRRLMKSIRRLQDTNDKQEKILKHITEDARYDREEPFDVQFAKAAGRSKI